MNQRIPQLPIKPTSLSDLDLIEVATVDLSSSTGYTTVKASIAEVKQSKRIFCVVRNTAGTWDIISDATHEPSPLVTGVVNGVGTENFRLNYTAMPKVGSIIASVDETYAKHGLFVGTSVGLTYTEFYLYKQGISGYISYNGSVWSIVLNNSIIPTTDFSFVFDGATGKLTVTHTNAALQNEAFATAITPRLGTTAYNMYLGALGSTTFEVYFKDYSGATVLVPTNQMKFYFTRNGLWQIPNSLLGIAASNIWIMGDYN